MTTIDAEISGYLWPLEPAEKQLLENSIRRDGCLDPLRVWNGILLDGHHRLEICRRLQIPYRTVSVEHIQNRDEALLWVSANQRGRRNLPDARRCELVLRDQAVEQRLAKERQKTSTGGSKPQLRAKLPEAGKGRARDVLASRAGVSSRTFEKAARIFKMAKPEIQHAVRRGELSIDGGYKKAFGTHVSHNSGENQWHTPPEFIEAARRAMGSIDLDPASSAKANEIVKATRFFTAEQDGLKNKWDADSVFLNPPYSQPAVSQFAERVAAAFESGEIKQAVVLVNNCTETWWFQRMAHVASVICFPRGRLKFLDVHGHPGAPLQGQAVLYFGEHTEKFIHEFSGFGFVARIAK